MVVVRDEISLNDLKQMSEKMFGPFVKAVVDIHQKIMVVDADMHADEEEFLLETENSIQENLWGINIYPEKMGCDDFIEFDSMINVRPAWGNRSRGVDNPEIQKKIRDIVNRLVK